MPGIRVEHLHHLIQSTAVVCYCIDEAHQEFTWFFVFMHIIRSLGRQCDTETFIFGRGFHFSETFLCISRKFFQCMYHFFFCKFCSEKSVQRLQRIIEACYTAHISDLNLLFLDHVQKIIFQFFEIHNVVLSGV